MFEIEIRLWDLQGWTFMWPKPLL